MQTYARANCSIEFLRGFFGRLNASLSRDLDREVLMDAILAGDAALSEVCSALARIRLCSRTRT